MLSTNLLIVAFSAALAQTPSPAEPPPTVATPSATAPLTEASPADTATVASSSNLVFAASLRARFESKQDFSFGADRAGNDEDFFLSQLRLSLGWRPTSQAEIFLELQDARIFGESAAINDQGVPNIFADDLDVHQAYLDLSFARGDVPYKLRLGRQKLNLGAKRLIASLEWVNTARVWDAARLTVGRADARQLDVFLSRLVAVDPSDANDWAVTGSRHFSSDFHGIYYTDWQLIPDTRWELYYLFRHQDRFEDRVHTVGSRFDLKRQGWDLNGELMLQGGRFGDLDHEAYALHLEAGTQVKKARLTLAYNQASGDSDPADGKHETFDNLYPLNHAYYGSMDFFALQNLRHLRGGLRLALPRQASLGFELHGFWLQDTADAWYNAGGGVIRRAADRQVDSFVGSEIDMTLSLPFSFANHSLATQVGVGRFFAGDFVEATGPSEDADFVYLQARFQY